MVAAFIVFKSQSTAETSETSLAVMKKFRSHERADGHQFHPPVQPHHTPAGQSGTDLPSYLHPSSPPQSANSGQISGSAPISSPDRSLPPSSKSPSGATPAINDAAAQSSQSVPVLSSRHLEEKRTMAVSEPLIFTDPGSILPEHPERDASLLDAAKQLALDLSAPGHAPGSPEYRDHWNRTVDLSNQLLRRRHGGQVWMAHHIQSHHLQSASAE